MILHNTLISLAALFFTGVMSGAQDLQNLTLCLMERPTEPVFMPKGETGIILNVPDSYLIKKYQRSAVMLKKRFSDGATTRVSIKGITVPDILPFEALPRRASFSNFIPMHGKLAANLMTILMGMKNADEFVSAAAYIRDRVNPNLFIYAFSVAVLHRSDTKDISLPPLSETFPDKFFDGSIFAEAREEANVLEEEKDRTPLDIPVDYTGTNLELEHRLAYFREDLGVNLHHWHWHLIYPAAGPRELIEKDRRGELFYYMHQQIIARYDFERMCNNLPRVKRLQNFNEPIEEAYFPKLNSQVASRNWAGRPSGTILKNIDREADELKYDIAELNMWRDRILGAIHSGKVEFANGTSVALTERDGIDILGNIMESSDLNPNPKLYGNFHNLLHVAVSLVHDPDHRHLETYGVLGDSATAMRDPVFYRIHALVNSIFDEHKKALPRYSVQQLEFTGVRVTGVEVSTPASPLNVIETFWQKSVVDLSRGMDFNPRGRVLAKFTHLNHKSFITKINVENQGTARQALVRLFLAPRFNQRGNLWSFEDHRNFFVEIDKFIFNLSPGENVITRDSRLSSVTIPFERSFRDLELGKPPSNASGQVQDEFNFCGCGWPQHMLIPKGSPEGYPSVLFAMISNYQTDWDPNAANREQGPCFEAASYCGIRDQAYPDRRSMGYPFDRQPRSGVVTTKQFLTPNMALGDVLIKFVNRVEDPFLEKMAQQKQERKLKQQQQTKPPAISTKPKPPATSSKPQNSVLVKAIPNRDKTQKNRAQNKPRGGITKHIKMPGHGRPGQKSFANYGPKIVLPHYKHQHKYPENKHRYG